MYRYSTCVVLFILLCSFSQAKEKKPADYVNPFIGAFTSGGSGKTIPGACTPFELAPNQGKIVQLEINQPNVKNVIVTSKYKCISHNF